jgi:hypothetical protein
MALINNLIRKYEAEAKERIKEARVKNGTSGQPMENRDDIFLKVDTPKLAELHEIGVKPGLGTGSIWMAKPLEVDVQKGMTPQMRQKTNEYTPQQKQPSHDQLKEEVMRLKQENAELRAKLGIVQVDA